MRKIVTLLLDCAEMVQYSHTNYQNRDYNEKTHRKHKRNQITRRSSLF